MSYILNKIKGFIVGAFLSTKKIDELLVTSNKDIQGSINETGIHQTKKHKSNFINKLIKGEINELYLKNFYKILKRSDQIFYSLNNEKEYDDFVSGVKAVSEIDKPRVVNFNKFSFEFFTKNDTIKLLYNEEIFKALREVVSDDGDSFKISDLRRSKMIKHRLSLNRKNDVVNKLEEITEYIRIVENRSSKLFIEFYIPLKYGVSEIPTRGSIFKQLTDISGGKFVDKYGDIFEFEIDDYIKRGATTKYHVLYFKLSDFNITDGVERIIKKKQ